MQTLYVKDNKGKDNLVGTLYEKDLVCKRSFEKHLYLAGKYTVADSIAKGYAGWALDYQMVNDLWTKHDVELVIIIVEKTAYIAPIGKFVALGTSINFTDHRPQLALNLKHFETHEVTGYDETGYPKFRTPYSEERQDIQRVWGFRGKEDFNEADRIY